MKSLSVPLDHVILGHLFLMQLSGRICYKLFQSAPLAKEAKIEMVTKRMRWGGKEKVEEDNIMSSNTEKEVRS